MNWNRRSRVVCTPAVGGTIVAGVVGAALLVSPLVGAQTAPYPEDYNNGGFCYQNPDGQENPYRVQFTEVEYRPGYEMARFSWQRQKWDGESSQYYDDGGPLGTRLMAKILLAGTARYADADAFCKAMTGDSVLNVGGVYPHGEWTSKHAPAPAQP